MARAVRRRPVWHDGPIRRPRKRDDEASPSMLTTPAQRAAAERIAPVGEHLSFSGVQPSASSRPAQRALPLSRPSPARLREPVGTPRQPPRMQAASGRQHRAGSGKVRLPMRDAQASSSVPCLMLCAVIGGDQMRRGRRLLRRPACKRTRQRAAPMKAAARGGSRMPKLRVGEVRRQRQTQRGWHAATKLETALSRTVAASEKRWGTGRHGSVASIRRTCEGLGARAFAGGVADGCVRAAVVVSDTGRRESMRRHEMIGMGARDRHRCLWRRRWRAQYLGGDGGVVMKDISRRATYRCSVLPDRLCDAVECSETRAAATAAPLPLHALRLYGMSWNKCVVETRSASRPAVFRRSHRRRGTTA